MSISPVTYIAVIIHLDMTRIELNRLIQQVSRSHTELLLLPLVGPALLRLVQIGVKEKCRSIVSMVSDKAWIRSNA
jgi:hypothetical protein